MAQTRELDGASLELRPMVVAVARRLRLLTLFFGQALIEESWRNRKTSRDWQSSLGSLYLASAPLVQLFDDAGAPLGDAFIDENSTAVAYFQNRINRAVEVLDRSDEEPSVSQLRATAHVRDAECGLIRWIKELGGAEQASTRYRSTLPSEDSVWREYRFGIRSLHLAMESRQPIDICMSSRRQFLRAYFMAVVQPQLWTSQCHAELVMAHEDALQLVTSGIESASLARRLEKLIEYTPQRFTEAAARSVA